MTKTWWTRICLSGLLATGIVLAVLAGCGDKTSQNPKPATKQKVSIQAAASLTESLGEIKKKYEAANNDVELVISYASSGQCAKAIQSGVPCDLFISAGAKAVKDLEEAGLVDSATKVSLLKNTLVLVVADDSKLVIAKPEDLLNAEIKRVAIGEFKSVPAGQYAKEALEKIGIWDKLQTGDKLSLELNVKAVVERVAKGFAPAGIVYATDVQKGAGVKKIYTFPADSHSPIVYPAVIVKKSELRSQAEKFLKYLQSEDGMTVFKSFGFTPAAK